MTRINLSPTHECVFLPLTLFQFDNKMGLISVTLNMYNTVVGESAGMKYMCYLKPLILQNKSILNLGEE